MIFYRSTRSTKKGTATSAEVIKNGLAQDGGLYVPETLPKLSLNEIRSLCKDDYPTRAAKILVGFLTDYTYDELLQDCRDAYCDASFPGGAAPVVNLTENRSILELWHGPTAAFKDMALQLMPRLLSRALDKTGENRDALILVATSGDTGKAALEGYKNVDRVRMMVYYPVDGVSRVQKLQMSTQEGKNVGVTAIRGNFDDAQSAVKAIFANEEITEELNKRNHFFSSANSINWGRLVPQIVYYVSAYCDLVNEGKIKVGDFINVCVPTGNFGNIFAGWIAKKIGLPIDRMLCASNSNNILTDFLNTGVYDRNRQFHLTMSPSMDILISSNLERLLYFVAGPIKTAEWMKELKETGKYTVDQETFNEIRRSFVGYYATEEMTADAIATVYKENNYLMDTHTAVAWSAVDQYEKQTGDKRPIVIDSTASPFKFAGSVYRAITTKGFEDEIETQHALSDLTGVAIPYPLKDLEKREIRFNKVVEKTEIADTVTDFLTTQGF